MHSDNHHIKKVIVFSFIALFSTVAVAQNVNVTDNSIKKNVSVIESPLAHLLRLEPKVFEYNKVTFKDLKLPEGKQYGFIAEEVQNVFPALVTYKNYNYMHGKNSYRTARIKTVDVESLIPVLVASIKEQQQEIEKLKAEIQALKNKTNP